MLSCGCCSFSAGMCVGWSFEIAYIRLRMLFFLCRDVCRMVVRNRLCLAADVIVFCRDVCRMVVRNRFCSVADVIVLCRDVRRTVVRTTLYYILRRPRKSSWQRSTDFTPSAAYGLRKACIFLFVSYFLEVIWKQRCLRSYFT